MEIIDVDAFLDSDRLPLIDVRSPREYCRGHIPGALNVPLFDDAERAEVGTLYKRIGRIDAVKRGLAIAEAKAERLVESIHRIAPVGKFVVHCWRGGMRSEGVAWLCGDCGLQPRVLSGGYKAFRRAAHRCFAEPRRVVLLAGHTGAGKTRLLSVLQQHDQQVIDLEGLANHRGSAFGGIGQPPQPTAEQFENHLYLQWRNLDADRPVWIEGESRAIGKVQIPQPVWDQMVSAPIIFVEVDRDCRVEFLVEEYGNLPIEQLAAAVQKIGRRLGGARLQSALMALQRGDVTSFAAITLDYYDQSYARALGKYSQSRMERVPLQQAGEVNDVAMLIQLANELTENVKIGARPNLSPEQPTVTGFAFRL